MTEKIVQGILDRFLTKYLKNVTTEHATVWGGQLVFNNVELRLDVLQVSTTVAVCCLCRRMRGLFVHGILCAGCAARPRAYAVAPAQ